jgi:hypothetical protein
MYKVNRFLSSIPFDWLLGVLSISVAIDAVFNKSQYAFYGAFITILLTSIYLWTNHSKHQIVLNKHFLWAFIILLTSSAIVLHFGDTPAHAQFFYKAEEWAKANLVSASANTGTSSTATSGSTNVTTVISFIFNTLRFILIVYVGTMAAKIFNALREDDDWKQIARTPMIIFIGVTALDFAVGFIIQTPAATP